MRRVDPTRDAGMYGNYKEQIATVRPPKERKAMGWLDLGLVQSHKWFVRPCYKCAASCHKGNNDEEVDIEDEEDTRPQYTLTSRLKRTGVKTPFRSFRQKICYCCSNNIMTTEERRIMGTTQMICFVDVNRVIAKYLSWSYRTSYFFLLNNFAILYFLWVLLFTVIYYLISLEYPECVNSGGDQIGAGAGARKFGDCFQLSWTTFSTVGYGVIFPATGASSFYVPTGCVGVGVVGSLEAFLGVLYAGCCGAILFGKVLRSQNNAQVFFSDPMVIRFGKQELSGNVSPMTSPRDSIKEEANEDQDEELGGEDTGIPCPSLEFRIVNRLHAVPQGEIVEAKLDAVAILDPKMGQVKKSLTSHDTGSSTRAHLNVNKDTTIAELAKVLEKTGGRKGKRSVNFFSTNSKQPNMFTGLTLDAEEHPYFRRVWFGRHRLDEESPLLTPAARKRVRQAGGYWPSDMNNYKSIKESIHFKSILVCISGTSNANAASVYAQKVYDLVDVHVGYRFVPMNYHTDEGELKTDPYLLNAVYQQRGGGAEPLQ